MMTFIVNGIRQEKDAQYPVEMLLEISSLTTAKQLLEAYGILILTIKPYIQTNSSFGNIVLTLQHTTQSCFIVLKDPDLQHACNQVVSRGGDVKKIDTYPSSVPAEMSDQIIAQAKSLLQTTQSQQDQYRSDQRLAEQKIYPDTDLQQVKAMGEVMFEKVRTIKTKAQGVITTQELKTLTTLTEDLKKIRMGNNVEKMKEIIEDIMEIILDIDKRYYTNIQSSSPLFAGSYITEQNVEQEISLWENIKILQSLGSRISIKNKDYARFGKRAIVRKFIQQDIKIRFQNIGNRVYSVFDLAELVIIIVTIALGVYTVANDVYMLFANQVGLAYMAISMGLRGIGVMVAKLVRNKNIGRSILIIGGVIVMHYLLMRGIQTNFAL